MNNQVQTLSKREFIKRSALGLGAMTCGFNELCIVKDVFGSAIENYEPLQTDKLEKWTIEASFYIETPKGLKCLICPNECKMLEGETSECKTKTNINGKLYSIAYGNPCAVHIDPIEKKPLFHFLPSSKAYSIATAGCNLKCLNCQNWEISQASPTKTKNYDLPPKYVVEECIKSNCRSIAYTYSDPVAYYEYCFDTAKIAREKGIKNVLVSAGYINEKPLRELCKYIDAANIDLKSFSNENYEMLNAGKLDPVLNTLKILRDEGVWLEITNLVVPNWTDDLGMISEMCDWLANNGFRDYPLFFSRFFPKYKLLQLPPTPVTTLIKAREIALAAGLNYVYIGNVPGTNAENTICPHCKNIVVERKGFQIINYNLQNGNCNFCNTKINGIWSS